MNELIANLLYAAGVEALSKGSFHPDIVSVFGAKIALRKLWREAKGLSHDDWEAIMEQPSPGLDDA